MIYLIIINKYFTRPIRYSHVKRIYIVHDDYFQYSPSSTPKVKGDTFCRINPSLKIRLSA